MPVTRRGNGCKMNITLHEVSRNTCKLVRSWGNITFVILESLTEMLDSLYLFFANAVFLSDYSPFRKVAAFIPVQNSENWPSNNLAAVRLLTYVCWPSRLLRPCRRITTVICCANWAANNNTSAINHVHMDKENECYVFKIWLCIELK